MEGDTPRGLIRGVLQATKATISSQRHRRTPAASSSSPRGSRTSARLSRSRFASPSHGEPISSQKVSSSVKRPAQQSSTSRAKRQRSVTSTPSETITPRTNIRAYLAAANTKTPAQASGSETRGSHQQLSRSAISDRQIQELIASESTSRKTSLRKRLSQSLPTPRESISPREAIKLYLKEVNTEPRRSRRSTPSKRNTVVRHEEGSEEEHADSSANDEMEIESGDEKGESAGEGVEYGEEKVEYGEEKVESGEEKVEYGNEDVESQEEDVQNDHPEHETESHASQSPQHEDETQHELYNAPVEDENKYESSQEATADSSQDEQDVAGISNKSSRRIEQDLSQEETHEIVFDITNRSRNAKGSAIWNELRTPVLPDTTTVKATPVALGKPPIPAQHKKPSNIQRKASEKQNQKKKANTKSSSVVRLPASLVNGIFRHFSALRVSKDALDAIQVGSDAFFEHIAMDLGSYCKHARRKTIEEPDVELLMRRQGLVKSRESFHALIEKYLPMEYRQEIIPTARSGNKVVPKVKT